MGFVRGERTQGWALNQAIFTFLGKKGRKTHGTIYESSALSGSSFSDYWIPLLRIWKREMMLTLFFWDDGIETMRVWKIAKCPCHGRVLYVLCSCQPLYWEVFVRGHTHQCYPINVCWMNIGGINVDSVLIQVEIIIINLQRNKCHLENIVAFSFRNKTQYFNILNLNFKVFYKIIPIVFASGSSGFGRGFTSSRSFYIKILADVFYFS